MTRSVAAPSPHSTRRTRAVADQPSEVSFGSVFSVASRTTRSGASDARSARCRPRWWKPPQPAPTTRMPVDRDGGCHDRGRRDDATAGDRLQRPRDPETRARRAPALRQRRIHAVPPRPSRRRASRSPPRERPTARPGQAPISQPSRPRANVAAAVGSIQAPTGAPQTVTWSRISSSVAGPMPLTSIRSSTRRERTVLIPVLDDRGREHLADARERLQLGRGRRVDVDEASRTRPGAVPPGTTAPGGPAFGTRIWVPSASGAARFRRLRSAFGS